MFNVKGHAHQASRHSINFWYALAALAGAINVGAFLSTERFVSHVTGFYSLFAVHLARDRNWIEAVGYLSVPLYFVGGAMLSSYLVEHQLNRQRRPLYYLVMLLEALLLAFVAFLGSDNYFGVFGEVAKLEHDYLLLAILALAMGLQNAVISSVSGAVVRTTHMTGLSTDLGISLVKLLGFGSSEKEAFKREWTSIRLRLGLIGSFTSGGVLGGFTFLHFQYLAFGVFSFGALLLVGLSLGLFSERKSDRQN